MIYFVGFGIFIHARAKAIVLPYIQRTMLREAARKVLF